MKLLRCKIGAYAGQLVEYPEHVAENLLMTGQAEEPTDSEVATYYGRETEEATLPEVEKATKPRRKRKAKK